MQNQSIGNDKTWQEGDLIFSELIRQEYSNCCFSGGIVLNHPIDTMYLKCEKNGVTTTCLLLRPDEMAAIGWVANGVLWSDLISKVK